MTIIKYKNVPSTQTTAKKLKNPRPWTVVWAQEQKGGYGRKKTEWFSPRGGLYFSVILPKSQIDDLQTLTILAAFVMARIIKEDFGLEPFIKLPNDIYINQKKVAGVLTENIVGQEIKFSVMGIGLNTNIKKVSKNLEKKATSLRIELGKRVDDRKILRQFIEGLKSHLKTISR